MPQLETAPHLEGPDIQPATQTEADRMRTAAVRASELRPALERIAGARDLLHQLRGFIAAGGLQLPIEVEQTLTQWWHEDVMARKEQES